MNIPSIKNNVFLWIMVLITGIFIFYVSSLEFEQPVGGIGLKSILYHLSVFFIFTFFLLLASLKNKINSKIFLVMIISIIYGFLDELHQFFVPGRNSEFFDILLDSIGIIFAITSYIIVLKLKTLKKPK